MYMYISISIYIYIFAIYIYRFLLPGRESEAGAAKADDGQLLSGDQFKPC